MVGEKTVETFLSTHHPVRKARVFNVEPLLVQVQVEVLVPGQSTSMSLRRCLSGSRFGKRDCCRFCCRAAGTRPAESASETVHTGLRSHRQVSRAFPRVGCWKVAAITWYLVVEQRVTHCRNVGLGERRNLRRGCVLRIVNSGDRLRNASDFEEQIDGWKQRLRHIQSELAEVIWVLLAAVD